MYKNLSDKFLELINLLMEERKYPDDPRLKLAAELNEAVMGAIESAYEALWDDEPQIAQNALEDLLSDEEVKKLQEYSTYPFIVKDGTFGFIMKDDTEKPLRFATEDEAINQIYDWFCEQGDTDEFSVVNEDTGETVSDHQRGELETPGDEEGWIDAEETE